MRPYADRMQELMIGPARAASSFRNLPLMERREEKRVGVVVFSGDRGLAGPFNGQVLRRAFELERQLRADGREVVWTVVGRKGASTLRFRRYEVAAQWAGPRAGVGGGGGRARGRARGGGAVGGAGGRAPPAARAPGGPPRGGGLRQQPAHPRRRGRPPKPRGVLPRGGRGGGGVGRRGP